MVFMGVRPCDAAAIARLDELFNWDYEDTYYNRRRKSSILMGLACNQLAPTCFCTSLGEGLGPHQKDHVDVMLTEKEKGSYVMEAVTEVGKELMNLVPQEHPATLRFDEKTLEHKERAEKRADLYRAFKGLDENFDSPYWRTAARKCIGCGICTYLCPSCHCFDILDEGKARVRFWDSCQFALYTRHVGGHNPRNEPYKRLRNRIYHKFVYYEKHFGKPLCTGCGRCRIYCPVKIDIFKIVSEAEREVNIYSETEGSG
jgi:ferredoxin